MLRSLAIGRALVVFLPLALWSHVLAQRRRPDTCETLCERGGQSGRPVLLSPETITRSKRRRSQWLEK